MYQKQANEIFLTWAADMLPNKRPSDEEAHRSRSIMQLNYFMEKGAILFEKGGKLSIVRNTIAENQGTPVSWGLGGGVYVQSTAPWLDANTIVDNVAAVDTSGYGGGVVIISCAPFTLTNNIIARNDASTYGSGVAIGGPNTGKLAHNTIADNELGDGVGVYVEVSGIVELLSNIIAGHTTGTGIVNGGGDAVLAKYTLFENNLTNYSGGVNSTYEVAGPAALLADYHIAGSSGAIDQAPFLNWVTWDIDGDLRPLGPKPDVGADEYGSLIRLPLVVRNAHFSRVREPR